VERLRIRKASSPRRVDQATSQTALNFTFCDLDMQNAGKVRPADAHGSSNIATPIL
jgi:hypothetical protein